MHYQMLLWPHANARYQAQTQKLAEAELKLMLDHLAPGSSIAPSDMLGMPGLRLRTEAPLNGEALCALRRHSLLYGLFECPQGDALVPLAGRMESALGADLPAILKYKGKTNEMFLQLLINVALYSSDYWSQALRPLKMLDPMCGRATSLFVAANFGWDVAGADVDRADLDQAEKYFKRYLEYHRVKHGVERLSRTLKQGGSAPQCRFEYAPPGQSERRCLSLMAVDSARSPEAFGRNAWHVIVCDLPYGVRHDAHLARGERTAGNWLETLLRRALPGWVAALKGGGTIALSFNAQNMPLGRVREQLAEAGLEVLSGGVYDGFSHWVEQAITRDIAVGRKSAG